LVTALYYWLAGMATMAMGLEMVEPVAEASSRPGVVESNV
jgi:hypothetical protein